AELEAMKVGGASASPQARKWYYETINRFPYSPGATLARERLMPCGDHGGFASDAAVRFFDETASRFDGHGEVVVTHYPDFMGLNQVRTLIAFGLEKKAVDTSIAQLKLLSSLPTANGDETSARSVIGDLLATIFRKTILDELKHGKSFEALQFYEGKMAALPKVKPELSEVDPDFLLQLSQVASGMGLTTLGQKLADEFATRSKARTGRALASEGSNPSSGDIDQK